MDNREELFIGLGLKIAKEAIDYTNHARRKTVKDRDIKIAAKKVNP